MPFSEGSMRRFRITLAVAMAAVVYLGFAFAAVLRPTALWAEAWSTGNLVVLAVAVLGAIYSKGGSKVFWGGFAIVGGGFLALNIFGTDLGFVSAFDRLVSSAWDSYSRRVE
jgi:hypothetical protein